MSDREPPRILIVDDEPFMRTTVKAMLRMIGRFLVMDATDGTDALAKVSSFKPDLIIFDIGMVPMGGIEFVDRLHEHDDIDRRQTAVIMLTADRNETTIMAATRLQLAGYLVKPVSSKKLGTLVNMVFQHLNLV